MRSITLKSGERVDIVAALVLQAETSKCTEAEWEVLLHASEEIMELRHVLSNLLSRISTISVDMGGNHAYHIRGGRPTVEAMTAANMCLFEDSGEKHDNQTQGGALWLP